MNHRWSSATRLACLLIGLLYFNISFGQKSGPVKFSFSTQHVNDSIAYLKIKATIAPGIKLFALQKSSDDLVYSSISFDSSVASKIAGAPIAEGNLQKEKDAVLEGDVQ